METNGNLQVGFKNMEIGSYEAIESIKSGQREFFHGRCWDDDTLGEHFIKIDN